jgi:hypothetical protein
LSHIACGWRRTRPGTVATESVEQCLDRDEVGEGALAVDLDHGQVLAVLGLERRRSADVDELQRERLALQGFTDDDERLVAEVAAFRVIERDDGRGEPS